MSDFRLVGDHRTTPRVTAEAATGDEEVAALDDAGAGDARHLGSSHPVFILLVVPDEALDVLIAAARAGGKMLALKEAATTRDLVLSRTSWGSAQAQLCCYAREAERASRGRTL